MSGPKSSSQIGLAWTLAAEIRAVSRKLRLRLRGHGGRNNLTPSQASVLLRLEKDGAATVSSLARAEGMRPQSMSAIVTPLQESGLVRGAPDPGDGRPNPDVSYAEVPEVDAAGQGRETGLAGHDHRTKAFCS